jgi:hypothetical protein
VLTVLLALLALVVVTLIAILASRSGGWRGALFGIVLLLA